MEEVPPTDGEDEEFSVAPKSRKKLWIIIAAVLGILAIAALVFCLVSGKCSKYKGYKKDRATGIYYQFFGDIHDTAVMPKTGDLVGMLFSLRAGDSVLIPMSPNEMLMDSLYEGDIYAALRMMHVGDSASFILDGKEFFRDDELPETEMLKKIMLQNKKIINQNKIIIDLLKKQGENND